MAEATSPVAVASPTYASNIFLPQLGMSPLSPRPRPLRAEVCAFLLVFLLILPENPVTESADAIRAKLIKLNAELEAMDEAGGGGTDGTEQEQAFANMQSQYCLAYCKERILPKLVDWKYLEDALEECEENESTRQMIKNHRKTPFWVNDAAERIRLVCFTPLKSE